MGCSKATLAKKYVYIYIFDSEVFGCKEPAFAVGSEGSFISFQLVVHSFGFGLVMHLAAILLTIRESLAESCVGCTAGAGFVQYHRRLSQGLQDDFCEGKQGLFAAPVGPGNEDCQGYYNCWHGNEPMQFCGSGQRFNPDRKNCDWSRNVACDAETTEAPSTTAASSSTTQGTTTAVATTSGSSDPSEFCEGKRGLYAAPVDMAGNEDCRGYFNCFRGNEPMQLCPPGQRFNAARSNCDWSANVECSATTTAAGTTTAGGTTTSMNTSPTTTTTAATTTTTRAATTTVVASTTAP